MSLENARTRPHEIEPSAAEAETLATVGGEVAYVSLSVPVILLPQSSTAADVPAGTPIRTFVLVKA